MYKRVEGKLLLDQGPVWDNFGGDIYFTRALVHHVLTLLKEFCSRKGGGTAFVFVPTW